MIDKKKLEEIYNVDWAKMPKDLITVNVSLEQWKYMIEELNLSCRMIELIYDKKKGYTETLRIKFSKFVKNDRKESTRLSNLYFYGVESTNSLESKKIKTKDTMNERYGDWFTKTDDYIEKAKNTNLKRYGTEFASQNEEIKKKVQETNIKNCGYKTNLSSEDNIKKSKQTKMQRYGNPNYVNYEKSCQTKLEKYGDKNYNNIEQIKKAWANKSIEEKKDIFHRQSIKAKETNLLKYGVEHYSQTKEFLIKSYNTMKKNNTFNVSFEEDTIYELLSNRFPDVIRQYRSKLYPFNCDFYIPSIDIYIEYQGNWTHGDEPFNSENIEHLNRLKEWENKSKYHPYYKNAIYVWTNLDIRKRDIARQNNINFIEFWSMEEVEKFISDFSKK